jgi:gamma-glutamylcyclotransferase (GGCT)/AIG2-like uncharacterized protein YtfP
VYNMTMKISLYFKALVRTRCWAYMVQEKSAQAGVVDNGNWRFDSKA